LALNTYSFEYTEELQLIVIIASIDDYDVRLALDTGASSTVIDLTELLIAGYRKSDAIGSAEFETGKGNIMADTYQVAKMEAFGIKRENFILNSYDFLVNSVLSAIHGVLGLDFFEGRKFCIDMDKREITIQ
jgi:gag-polyprotein putative aspartyl protease